MHIMNKKKQKLTDSKMKNSWPMFRLLGKESDLQIGQVDIRKIF